MVPSNSPYLRLISLLALEDEKKQEKFPKFSSKSNQPRSSFFCFVMWESFIVYYPTHKTSSVMFDDQWCYQCVIFCLNFCVTCDFLFVETGKIKKKTKEMEQKNNFLSFLK